MTMGAFVFIKLNDACRMDEAINVYEMGLAKNAQPLVRLTNSYNR